MPRLPAGPLALGQALPRRPARRHRTARYASPRPGRSGRVRPRAKRGAQRGQAARHVLEAARTEEAGRAHGGERRGARGPGGSGPARAARRPKARVHGACSTPSRGRATASSNSSTPFREPNCSWHRHCSSSTPSRAPSACSTGCSRAAPTRPPSGPPTGERWTRRSRAATSTTRLPTSPNWSRVHFPKMRPTSCTTCVPALPTTARRGRRPSGSSLR